MSTDEENHAKKMINPEDFLIREAIRSFRRREYPNLSQAARAFNVSYARVYYRYKNNVTPSLRHGKKRDNKGKLKNSEIYLLVRWIDGELHKRDFLRLWEVAGVVQDIISNRRSAVNRFGRPGKRPEITEAWTKTLIKRISATLMIEVSHGYIYRNHDEDIARKTQEFFDYILAARTNYKIPRNNIFCVSETGLQLAQSSLIVSSSLGKEIVLDVSRRLTIMECICAEGTVLKPFVCRFTDENEKEIADLRIRTYHNSWDTDLLLVDWLENHFIPLTSQENQSHIRILISFGNRRNLTPEFREICERNEIIPVCIPTQAWPYFSRVDFSTSRLLTLYYESRIQAMTRNTESLGEALDVYLEAREAISNSSSIKSNFERTGLVPLVPDKVLSQILPIEETDEFGGEDSYCNESYNFSSSDKEGESQIMIIEQKIQKRSFGSDRTYSDKSSDDASWRS